MDLFELDMMIFFSHCLTFFASCLFLFLRLIKIVHVINISVLGDRTHVFLHQAKPVAVSCLLPRMTLLPAHAVHAPRLAQNAHTLLQCRGLSERKQEGRRGGVNDLASPLSEYFICHHPR